MKLIASRMRLSESTPADLPRWSWLYLPLAFAAAQVITRGLDAGQGFYFRLFEGEIGVVELGTFAVLLPAIVMALMTYRSITGFGERWLGWWLLLFALGCLYFAGEEISWGQDFVGWKSPEFFQTKNLQKETNLHNLGLGVDRIPKFLVAVVLTVVGLILPIVRRARGVAWTPESGRLYWLLPTGVGTCAVGLAIAFRVAERIKTWFDLEAKPFFDINLKESHEFFLALFFALYMASLYVRLRSNRPKTARPAVSWRPSGPASSLPPRASGGSRISRSQA